jgi:hypothetical protein
MMPSIKIISFFILFGFFCFAAKAQNCTNCNEVPRIAGFDLDIRVPQPNAQDGTENLWPEWKSLFQMAGFVSAAIMQKEGSCLRFFVPPSVDTSDVQMISVGGETFTNLPSNPDIAADLSKYGDYIFTGTITGNSNCVLHVEIQTACSRKTIAVADISFQLSSLMDHISSIANQASVQLGSVHEKIKQFELSEKQKDRSLTLFKIGEQIKITVQKKILKAGESTPITVELKDCDGLPIVGRTVLFNSGIFEGMKITGTIGGTVSPASLVTDENGTGHGNFTLKSGAAEAIINAYSPGNDVNGCASMMIGDAPVNIHYSYSGYVTYELKSSSNCVETASTACTKNTVKNRDIEQVTYRASFFTDVEAGGTVFTVSGADDEEPGTKVPDLLEGGSSSLRKMRVADNVYTCASVVQGKHDVHKMINRSEGTLNHGTFSIELPAANGGGGFSLHIDVDTQSEWSIEATGMDPQKGSDKGTTSYDLSIAQELDKEFTFKRDVIKGKVRYIISGSRTRTYNCNSITETIKVVVEAE